jgi:F0F1-type ATP synthase assembly protein I
MMISNGTVDRDSKSRKMTKKIVIVMIVDSIYAVCFIIWRKKKFFFSVVVGVGNIRVNEKVRGGGNIK